MGLPTPFSLQPQRRGSLLSSLFLAPLAAFHPPHSLRFARVNKSCGGCILQGAHCCGGYDLPQMPKESGGVGLGGVTGVKVYDCRYTGGVLSRHGRSRHAWYMKSSFETRHSSQKSKQSLRERLFSPVDVGFAGFCACTLSERKVEFLVRPASLRGGGEDPTVNAHHPDVFHPY